MKNSMIIVALFLSTTVLLAGSGESGKKSDKSESNREIKVNVESVKTENRYVLEVDGIEDELVYVNIYDDKSQLVYTDIVEVGSGFKKGYDLSKIASDLYIFEVVSENSVITKTIE